MVREVDNRKAKESLTTGEKIIMRKTSEEITRAVYGESSRWIGWDNWLKHQPIFKYIEKKVEEGLSVMSTKHFMVRHPLDPYAWDMIYVAINHKTGALDSLTIPGSFDARDTLLVRANSSLINLGDFRGEISEMFEDPWRPTFEELDLFEVLYGDDQVLLELNRGFFGTVQKFNKAALRKETKIVFWES